MINAYHLSKQIREEQLLKAIRKEWRRAHRNLRGDYPALVERNLSNIRRFESVLEVGYW